MYYIDIANATATYTIRYAEGNDKESAIRNGVIKLLPKLANELKSMKIGDDIVNVLENYMEDGFDIDFVLRQSNSKSPILDLWKSNIVLVQGKQLFKDFDYLSVDKFIYNPTANDIIKNCILLVRPATHIAWFESEQRLMKKVIESDEQTIVDILYLHQSMLSSVLDGKTVTRFVNIYNNSLNLLPVLALKDNVGKLNFEGLSVVRKPWSMFPLQFNISRISKIEATELLKLARLFINTTDVDKLISYFNLDKFRIEI